MPLLIARLVSSRLTCRDSTWRPSTLMGASKIWWFGSPQVDSGPTIHTTMGNVLLVDFSVNSVTFWQKLLILFFPIWEKQNIAKASFVSRVVNWNPKSVLHYINRGSKRKGPTISKVEKFPDTVSRIFGWFQCPRKNELTAARTRWPKSGKNCFSIGNLYIESRSGGI